MLRRLLLVLPVFAIALALSSLASAKSRPALSGEVGPGFTIEVKQGSKDVKTLKAGTYTIKVEDASSAHNFRLKGPGLNKSTTVPFKGEVSWKITLKPGRYTYQCDPHATTGMKGTFLVKT